MEVNGQFYSLTALPTWKVPLGGPQNLSGQFGEEKGLLPLLGIEPQFLIHPAPNLVTILTELTWHFALFETHMCPYQFHPLMIYVQINYHN
jgi:hypothetical protein